MGDRVNDLRIAAGAVLLAATLNGWCQPTWGPDKTVEIVLNTALLGGHVDVVPASVSSWVARLQAGEIRLLAVAAPQRMTGAIAHVPTWREQGVNAVVSNWRGIVGPRGLTPSQVAFWEGATRKAIAADDWKRELEQLLLSDEFLASREFQKYLDEQYGEVKALLSDLELLK